MLPNSITVVDFTQLLREATHCSELAIFFKKILFKLQNSFAF